MKQNTLNVEISISKLGLQIKPLSNYNIIHEEKSHPWRHKINNQRARLEKFFNLLNIDTNDITARETIEKNL